MEQIQIFPYRNLTNGNASLTYSRLAEPYEKLSNIGGGEEVIEAIRLVVFPKITSFIIARDKFEENLRQTVGSAITLDMKPRESERDRTTNMAVQAITNGKKSTRPDVVKASNIVDVKWKSYGNISQRQQDEQTEITENLLRDLSTAEMNNYVQMIPGLSPILEALLEINEEFSALANKRIDERKSITKGLTLELRVIADTSASDLATAVNVVASIYEHPELSDIIKTINVILDQARTDYIARQRGIDVKNKNKEEEENND